MNTFLRLLAFTILAIVCLAFAYGEHWFGAFCALFLALTALDSVDEHKGDSDNDYFED